MINFAVWESCPSYIPRWYLAIAVLIILQLLASTCALAQPVSIGGVIPGKTTAEELRSLVVEEDSEKVGTDQTLHVKLRALPDTLVHVDLYEGVVLRTTILFFDHKDEVLTSLFAKYGRPKQRTGRLREVTCQNRLGAKFQRIEGSEIHAWPKRSGISASITYDAGKCASSVLIRYVLERSDIAAKLKRDEELREQSEKIDRVRRLQNGL